MIPPPVLHPDRRVRSGALARPSATATPIEGGPNTFVLCSSRRAGREPGTMAVTQPLRSIAPVRRPPLATLRAGSAARGRADEMTGGGDWRAPRGVRVQ